MNKVKNKKGETLIESLVAFAILAVIMLAFPVLIVNVNKLNATVKKQNISYSRNGTEIKDNVQISITDGTNTYTYTDVSAYKDDDFYYYE